MEPGRRHCRQGAGQPTSRRQLHEIPNDIRDAIRSHVDGGAADAPRVTVVHGQEPTTTFTFPHDGDILAEPPTVLQICFAEPIDIRDLDKGGYYDFAVSQPSGMRLGTRNVFQLDGYGVAIYPGRSGEAPEGTWKFEWRVRDAKTLNPLPGAVTFEVQPGGAPVPKAVPPDCTPAGRPQTTASPQASATNTPAPDGHTWQHQDRRAGAGQRQERWGQR